MVPRSRIYKNHHRHKMIRHTKLIDHILRLPSLDVTLQCTCFGTQEQMSTTLSWVKNEVRYFSIFFILMCRKYLPISPLYLMSMHWVIKLFSSHQPLYVSIIYSARGLIDSCFIHCPKMIPKRNLKEKEGAWIKCGEEEIRKWMG